MTDIFWSERFSGRLESNEKDLLRKADRFLRCVDSRISVLSNGRARVMEMCACNLAARSNAMTGFHDRRIAILMAYRVGIGSRRRVALGPVLFRRLASVVGCSGKYRPAF